MRPRFSPLLGGVLFALSLQTSAHHGRSGQETRQTRISGSVKTPVSLAGPQGAMQIVDENDQLRDVPLAPSAPSSRADLTEATLPVGGRATILGDRNSDRKRFESRTARVASDGRNFDVYPDRIR